MHGDHIHKASGIKTKEVLLQNQVIFAAVPFFFKEGNPWSAITFFGSSEAGSCRKCDFCVRQTDLLKFCCSRKVISGCFQFKQCFSKSSVSKSTAITGMQFSVIQFFQHLYHFKYWIVFVNHCCNVYRHDYLIFARFHCIISSLSVRF